MIGANMAFSQKVLARVPGFDVELGPGRLGFFDDVLFARQLVCAGYRLVGLPAVVVEHKPDATRLRREAFVKRAVGQGRSLAYLAYHWEHTTFRLAPIRWLKRRLQLQLHRALRRGDPESEGITVAEFEKTVSAAYAQQYWLESKRPRLYEYHGLRKVARPGTSMDA